MFIVVQYLSAISLKCVDIMPSLERWSTIDV